VGAGGSGAKVNCEKKLKGSKDTELEKTTSVGMREAVGSSNTMGPHQTNRHIMTIWEEDNKKKSAEKSHMEVQTNSSSNNLSRAK